MTTVLILGISMAILSAVFWCLEAMPFVRTVRALDTPSSTNPYVSVAQSLKYLVGFLRASFKLWRLALDLLCTVWLTGAFNLGGSVTGAIIGLTISNVISLFLFIKSRK